MKVGFKGVYMSRICFPHGVISEQLNQSSISIADLLDAHLFTFPSFSALCWTHETLVHPDMTQKLLSGM